MSRDYKKSDRQPLGKSGSPMFTGILIGLVVGLAVAIGVAVYINFSPKPFVSRDKPLAESTKAATAASDGAQKAPPAETPDKNGKPAGKPRFDFYTILPGSEAPVSEQELKQEQAKKPDGAAGKEGFLLQVGAFQAAVEADNMKARLALLGLEASIQTASVPDKGVWHRVRIGPFADIDELNRARSLLAQNSIPFSLVKVREAGVQ